MFRTSMKEKVGEGKVALVIVVGVETARCWVFLFSFKTGSILIKPFKGYKYTADCQQLVHIEAYTDSNSDGQIIGHRLINAEV